MEKTTIFLAFVFYGVVDGAAETDCEMRHRTNEPDWTKPVCNMDGSYREYQCEAYSRSKCWCVYDNGMMIEGTEKDLYDSNVEYKKLNCAEARSKAPPAPNPPPISAPYTDARIGWHLAYRNALMEAYKKRCPSPCYSPCPCQPGQQYYYPYHPGAMVHHVTSPAPVPAPASAAVPAPVPAPAPVYYPYQAPMATYMLPYHGSCPDPCPDPYPCQRNTASEPSEPGEENAATGSGNEKNVTPEDENEN